MLQQSFLTRRPSRQSRVYTYLSDSLLPRSDYMPHPNPQFVLSPDGQRGIFSPVFSTKITKYKKKCQTGATPLLSFKKKKSSWKSIAIGFAKQENPSLPWKKWKLSRIKNPLDWTLHLLVYLRFGEALLNAQQWSSF